MSQFPPELPMRAEPLGYMDARTRGRPGIITAMGVISIVVAAIGALFSLGGVMMAFGFLMLARMPAPVFVPPTTAPPGPTVQVSGGPLVVPDEDGLGPGEYEIVLDAMQRRRPMNEAKQAQFEALMKQAGKRVFPTAGTTTTVADIRNNISESGVLPSASGDEGPHYFVVGAGRLEIYPDHAVFRPTGSSGTISVSAAPPNTGTNPTDVNSNVHVHNSYVTVTGPGATTLYSSSTTGPAMTPMPKVSPRSGLFLMVCDALNLLLAIFLLVIGMTVLRNSSRGVKLHWWFAGLKLPLVVATAVAAIWVWDQLMKSAMPPGTPAPPFNPMMLWAIFSAVLAAAYPIALLFVLRSRTVREFVSAVS